MARDSAISTMAAAPSVMPAELPAVTLPPSRNTGSSRPSASIVVSGRGCSSTATVVVEPFGPATSTPMISAARRSVPSCAFCWDSSANASCSSRVMSYMSTRFSAVSPMIRPLNGSSSPSRYIASTTSAFPSR